MLRALASKVCGSESALVFAPTEQAAGHAARVFEGQGCFAKLVDPGSRALRPRRAERSADDDICLLASPRDFAAAGDATSLDLAIVVGESRNARQLIHRLGHVVARKDDGRHARVVAVYVEGTFEDDQVDGAAPYISSVLPHAAKSERFTATDTDALVQFLAADSPVRV